MRSPLTHSALLRAALLWTLLTAMSGAFSSPAPAVSGSVQYVFSGPCNGLLHWVSVLYEGESDKISTVILRAKCPTHKVETFRIFRDIAIPVNLGGRFSDIVTQTGIDYLIDGIIVSPSEAVLKHKGPKTVLTCASPDLVGPPLKAAMCERFNLVARPPDNR